MRFKLGFVLGAAAGFGVAAKLGQANLDRAKALASKATGRKATDSHVGTRHEPVMATTASTVAASSRSGVITDLAAAGGAESSLATEVHGHHHEGPSAPGPSGPTDQDMYASDVQFGRAAAHKEELVDEAAASGTADQLIDEGAAPRAGSKAMPA